MSNFSDYAENKIVDQIFRARQWTAPTTIAIALYTAAPGETGGGTEVTGGSYARVTVGPSDAAWESTQGTTTAVASSGTTGATQNGATITFPTPTANWGSITHFAILDATSGGNFLMYGALTNAKTVNNGDPAPSFAAGAIDVTIA
jgi:hypothetical protein